MTKAIKIKSKGRSKEGEGEARGMLGQWDPSDVQGDGLSQAAHQDQGPCLSPTAQGSANARLKRALLIRRP